MISFDEIYRRYASDVHRFALYLCGDRAMADDIVSETFVRAWTSPSPIRTATVKGYLFAIARNLYVQELRRRSKQAVLEDVLPDRADLAGEAEHKDALRRTLAALQQVAEGDRTALLMCAVEEMSYDEIAVALGITLAAVKTRIHRARLKLVQLQEGQEANA